MESFSARVKTSLLSVVLDRRSTASAWLRGVFLCCGSVSDPARGSDLSLTVADEAFAGAVSDVMRSLSGELNPKISKRGGTFVVYLKRNEEISVFLGLIGAHSALLEFESLRVKKDVNNSINRRVNCENANMDKTISAAVTQTNNIRLIQGKIGLDALPFDLRRTAKLRLENPQLSIKELGELLTPKVGKSGVSHRLKKINAIAEGLKSAGV